MNKVKMALAGLCMLSMLSVLLLPNGAAARANNKAANVASSALTQAATATPEAGMMEHETATPDAMMAATTPEAGMMAGPTATAEAAMMHSNLPTTGGSDYSGVLALAVVAMVLLLAGVGMRKVLTAGSK